MVLTSASPISRIKSTKNDTLKIRYLKPWPDREEKNQLPELKSLEAFGLEVGLSWPMDWGDEGLRFLVNGKEAPFREIGGGFGEGRYEPDFLIFAGEPGKKELEVVFSSEGHQARARSEFNFQSSGDMIMLGKIDGEALFKLEKLNFVSWFLRDWQVRVNGEPKGFEHQEIFTGLHQLSLEPSLKPGLNTIEVMARDGRGQVRKLIKNIYYADSGRIKVGDEFIFRYECKNSKSLTTRLKLEGRAIEL